MIEAYPLCWPTGWPRTKAPGRWPRFKSSPWHTETRNLLHELRLLESREIVISTNLRLRQDGLPYASQRNPEDAGVAIYFQHKGHPKVLACDSWSRMEDNMRALCKTIEAMRGIERWGCSDFLDRAFTGFEALPETTTRPWWVVLGVEEGTQLTDCEAAYRRVAQVAHPDRGGSDFKMSELNEAIAVRRQANQ